MKKLLIFLFCCVFFLQNLQASALVQFNGEYKDENVTLKVIIRYSSSFVLEDGVRKGKSSKILEFHVVSDKKIENEKIIFQNSTYNFKSAKTLIPGMLAYINLSESKDSYKIEFSYDLVEKDPKNGQSTTINISKKLILIPGQYVVGGISSLDVKLLDLDNEKNYEKLQESLEIWKKYKEKHNGNYSYKICFEIGRASCRERV